MFKRFTPLNFMQYIVATNPMEYVSYFYYTMAMSNEGDALLFRVFPSSLAGDGFTWFQLLFLGSVASFNFLSMDFVQNYFLGFRILKRLTSCSRSSGGLKSSLPHMWRALKLHFFRSNSFIRSWLWPPIPKVCLFQQSLSHIILISTLFCRQLHWGTPGCSSPHLLIVKADLSRSFTRQTPLLRQPLSGSPSIWFSPT